MNIRFAVANMKHATAEGFPDKAKEIDAQLLDFDTEAYEVWLERSGERVSAIPGRIRTQG